MLITMLSIPNVQLYQVWRLYLEKLALGKLKNVKMGYWISVLILMLASEIFHGLVPIDVYPNIETD